MEQLLDPLLSGADESMVNAFTERVPGRPDQAGDRQSAAGAGGRGGAGIGAGRRSRDPGQRAAVPAPVRGDLQAVRDSAAWPGLRAAAVGRQADRGLHPEAAIAFGRGRSRGRGGGQGALGAAQGGRARGGDRGGAACGRRARSRRPLLGGVEAGDRDRQPDGAHQLVPGGAGGRGAERSSRRVGHRGVGRRRGGRDLPARRDADRAGAAALRTFRRGVSLRKLV